MGSNLPLEESFLAVLITGLLLPAWMKTCILHTFPFTLLT